MHVVVGQSDLIVFAKKEHGPVVLTIARRGPGGFAVEFVVRDCNTVGRFITCHDHLAADKRELKIVS